MIAFFLTALMLVAMVVALREWPRSRLLAITMAAPALAAIYLIWFPHAATGLANYLGVGRGADLILYLYAAITFVLMISLVLRLRALSEQLTELARAIALRHPDRGGESRVRAHTLDGDRE